MDASKKPRPNHRVAPILAASVVLARPTGRLQVALVIAKIALQVMPVTDRRPERQLVEQLVAVQVQTVAFIQFLIPALNTANKFLGRMAAFPTGQTVQSHQMQQAARALL